MNDEENFISRWSRRKREAADETVHSKKTDPTQTINPLDEQPGPGSQISAEPAAKEFDVSSLPPIESIGAGTDVTAFMQPGVPSALRHAALRRVWAADPAIRDFVGLNENYWNNVAGAAAAPPRRSKLWRPTSISPAWPPSSRRMRKKSNSLLPLWEREFAFSDGGIGRSAGRGRRRGPSSRSAFRSRPPGVPASRPRCRQGLRSQRVPEFR